MKSSVTFICLISFLGLKGIQAEAIQCYNCTDQGDGGCSPDKAVNVSCPLSHDMCIETLTTIKTSHDNHVVLKKGCGFGGPTTLTQNIAANGIYIIMQLNQCNASLCNMNMDLKNYKPAPEGNVTREPNDEQCYSCIGTLKTECSPSKAPIMQCYDTYGHCFDGNVTISVDNDTTTIPLKSCSTRYHCGVHSIAYGSANVQVKGACCSEGPCNSDLSNKTHLANLPTLVLLNEKNEATTTTLAPLNTTLAMVSATTNSSIPRDDEDSSSNYLPQDSQGNAATGLSFSLWLFFTLILLS